MNKTYSPIYTRSRYGPTNISYIWPVLYSNICVRERERRLFLDGWWRVRSTWEWDAFNLRQGEVGWRAYQIPCCFRFCRISGPRMSLRPACYLPDGEPSGGPSRISIWTVAILVATTTLPWVSASPFCVSTQICACENSRWSTIGSRKTTPAVPTSNGGSTRLSTGEFNVSTFVSEDAFVSQHMREVGLFNAL